jgi:ArsR family transcriptional regulator
MKSAALARKTEQPDCAPGEHRRRRSPVEVCPAEALERAVQIFKALGDSPRLRLLATLAQGELCVSEIAEIDDDGLSTVSQRLRVLRAAELVTRRRQGQHILYGLADQHISDLISSALAHAGEGLPVSRKNKKKYSQTTEKLF